MKKVFMSLMLILLLPIMVMAEGTSIPEKYQGTWNMIASSYDRGKTEVPGNGVFFADVGETKIKAFDGRVVTVYKTIEISENGVTYTCISFNELNGVVWAICDIGDGQIMVQTIQNGVEVIRVAFTIND